MFETQCLRGGSAYGMSLVAAVICGFDCVDECVVVSDVSFL